MTNSTLQLFKAQSGMLSAKIVREDGTLLHLHSIVKPEDEWRYFDEIKLWGKKIIFLGTGLGYHLFPIVKKVYNADMLFVEYYDELLEHCLKNVNAVSGSIKTISAKTADFCSVIDSFIDKSDSVQIIRHPSSVAANPEYYESILKYFYSRNVKMPVDTKKMMLLYGGFFLQEELKNALLQNEITPVLFNYRSVDLSIEYEACIEEIFQREKPSAILSVNMLGFDSGGILADLAYKYGIKLIVWFVDDPRPILLHQKQFIKPGMAAFCWEHQYVPLLKEAGFSTVEYLPLATDPALFSPEHGTQQHLAKVGFVGSSMGEEFLGKIAGKFLWKDELSGLVMATAKKVPENSVLEIDKIIMQECERIGIRFPFTDERNSVWFQSYIIHTASMLKRKRLVSALVPLRVKLFGDSSGWKKLLGENIDTAPDIDYRSELVSVYKGIDINLNITSSQMPTAVNQRVFDVPACGGFLLTDKQSDLCELFSNDEVAVYSNVEELVDKVKFFLNNEKERLRISCNARKRILGEHTYFHRLKKIRQSIT